MIPIIPQLTATAAPRTASAGPKILKGFPSQYRAPLLNSDGSLLFTIVNLLEVEELIALARSRLTRGLTEEECRDFLHVAQCQ